MEEDFVGFLTAKLNLAPTTIYNNRYRYRLYRRWLEEHNLQLNAQSCERFILDMKQKYSSSTLNMYMDLFSNLDKYFKDRGKPIVLSSGFKRFQREKKHIDILTPHEIERITTTKLEFAWKNDIWKRSEETYLLLTTFLAYTGCRYSEARDLLVENIDLQTGRVLIPKSKNGSFRYVYLPLSIIDRLKPILGPPKDLVFKSFRGEKIPDSNFLANLRKRAKAAGISKRVYPHLFRHSMATQLIIDGVPIEQVATILGHKDITTTYQNYLHLADQQIRKSMYRHELFKKATPTHEVLQTVVETFKNLKLDLDTRFGYRLEEGSNSVNLQLFIK